jgi:hypothetical protein
MTALMIAGLISFLAGLLGYIVFRFWLHPIGTYLKRKRELAAALKSYAAILEDSPNHGPPPKAALKELVTARRQMNAMLDSYSQDLPAWYRIRLQSVGAAPDGAAKALMGLDKVQDREQIAQRLLTIRNRLNI